MDLLVLVKQVLPTSLRKSWALTFWKKNILEEDRNHCLPVTSKSVLNNTSVVGFSSIRRRKNTKLMREGFVWIMDEVDGMSSGGSWWCWCVICFCRITNMPMILICNDKSLPKMRNLTELRWIYLQEAIRNGNEVQITNYCFQEKSSSWIQRSIWST